MDKKIVVSIDPFNIEHNIVEYAEELARAGNRNLLIYSVQGVPLMADPATYPSAYIPETLPGHIEEAESFARSFYEEVKARYPKTTFEHSVGFTASALVGRLEEMVDEKTGRAPCLLVISKTHGHNWWNEVVGTLETTLAADAPCPVLLVPEGMVYRGLSRVMYLADTQAVEAQEYKGFRFLRSFAEEFTADLAVGFICSPDSLHLDKTTLSGAMDKLKQSLPFHFGEEYRFFPEFSADEILRISELTHTDILAFPFRETSFFKRIFENDLTRELVLKANVPVLVF